MRFDLFEIRISLKHRLEDSNVPYIMFMMQ